MRKYIFQVSEEEEGERIDRHLSMLMDSFSRSYIQKLLKDELVLLEKSEGASRVLRASYRVQSGDRILLNVPAAVFPSIEAEDIPLDILFEDEFLLVVNKPKAMVVHPAPGHYSNTLVNALLYHCRDSLSGINGVLRPGIVHRIDRDTTGAILVCKSDSTHQEIARQLKERLVERRYLALVCGNIANESGTINTLIGRHPKNRKKMAVLPNLNNNSDMAIGNTINGKEAITHYKVAERFHKYSLLECRLETGRTHQIRVHLAYLGFPILGDEVYGNGLKAPFNLSGQTLHAATLGFVHPISKKYIEVEAPLPDYFVNLMKVVGDR
ncbi:MAG: RluA family pseudouridine synthase [Lachnospiraceae bacterium]|nr:RluA family pseudouridine synthase [Lachnospiraceae bacterium]